MMIADRLSPARLFQRDGHLVGSFVSMGCACEVLMDTGDLSLARELVDIAHAEATRVEEKFSRYRVGNVVGSINAGGEHDVDGETADLLDFADRCFEISGGLFDITSGLLRRAWTFDGGHRLPDRADVARLLASVGWTKATWRRPRFRLEPGMEIDLGGIGKEYAVDRALAMIGQRSDVGVLVNFGGDIAAGGRKTGSPWVVGIEDPSRTDKPSAVLHLRRGAVATSGDSKKFLLVDGKRYGHILDPRTGWPVEDAPRSVTVAADTCTEAGFLSTYGILNGAAAEAALRALGARFWCHR